MNAYRCDVPIPFMSIVPRPHILPSAISRAERIVASSARDPSGTTSMWLSQQDRLAAAAVPFSRASTIERPGADS